MSKRQSIAIILCSSLLWSAPALASDPTPLFVIFVEIPLLILSGIFLVVCVIAPKGGRILTGLKLFITLFVIGWAADAGYMDSGGKLLSISLLIDITALVVAMRRQNAAKSSRNG